MYLRHTTRKKDGKTHTYWRLVRCVRRGGKVVQETVAQLGELDAAVKAMPATNPKPNLLLFFTRIDELAEQLPPDADPALLHYLHKKSYEKARLWLEGRDAENQRGNCRHV